MSITKLDCMELKDTRYSVYPYDGYNLEEILGKFYEAIKECNNLSFSLQEFNNWLISEGLLEEVAKQLSKVDWDNVINSELYLKVVEQLKLKANAVDLQYLRPEWSKFWNENDCSDAIEDCINRLNGGVIKFSNKTYIITRPIDVKAGIRLEGTGTNATNNNSSTIIKLKDFSNCPMIRTPGAKNNDGDKSAIHYFEIDHIQFDGNGNRQSIDSVGLDLQAVYIMTKLCFVTIFNNRGTALSLSYGCDIEIDHVWINDTKITESDRYAFEFNKKRVEDGQSGMLNINHLYVENTSNRIYGDPKTTPSDRGNAVLLNKVYTANINELHIEGATIPITIGKQCFTILFRKLSFANCGNSADSENTVILLTSDIAHLKIDSMRTYNCVNEFNIKKKTGFVHNNFRDVQRLGTFSYEIMGYNVQPKFQPFTSFNDNIKVNLVENSKPLEVCFYHNDKGIRINHETSNNPKIYLSTNVNREDHKEILSYYSYGNDGDSFAIQAPLKLNERSNSTNAPNGSIFLKNSIPSTRIDGVIQNFLTIRTYGATPIGGGFTPQYVGQIYIDTANNKVYIGKGTNTPEDWILLN